MQPKQNIPILKENDNLLNNFEPYINKKSALERLNIEKDNINLIYKSLNTRICAKKHVVKTYFWKWATQKWVIIIAKKG